MMTLECWNIPGTPTPENSADDPELSSHIRHLLLSYVQTHITTPYAQFTQLAVSELLSGLKPIPVHDPTAITLPTDPLTLYLSTFVSAVEPYTEKLQTTNEAHLLIKRLLASKPPRVARFADGEDEEENYGYHRPSTPPILTRRAIRQTPVIGKTLETAKTYAAYVKTAQYHALRPVPLQEMPEPQVNFDQVLDVKHYIRAEDHAAVRALLKSTAKLPAPAHIHAYLPSSLATNSHIMQEHTPPPDSPPFMPIFPRRAPICPPRKGKRRRNSRGRSAEPTKRRNARPSPQSIPESMGDLPRLVKSAAVDEDAEKVNADVHDLDLCEENMIMVDGWQTYVTSSPSALSSNSNEEEDQLFLPSSPDTDVGAVALVKAVEDSKLEEVLIPRSRRIGSKPFVDGEKGKDPGVGRAISASYGRFLVPLLQPSSHRDSTTYSITSNKPSSQKIVETLDTDLDPDGSLLGQASGLSNLHTNGNDDDDGDAEIRQLYKQTTAPLSIQDLDNIISGLPVSRKSSDHLPHPHDFIRDEPLFDDDVGKGGKDSGVSVIKDSKNSKLGAVGALIPVPNLPEPNTYTAPRTRAATLAEYVAPLSGNPQNAGDRSRGFLRKAKGVAGLRVALSWVPFTLSSPADLPDHARVVDVDVLRGPGDDVDEMRRGEERLVQELLKRAVVTEDSALDGSDDFRGVGEHLWSVLGDDDDSDRHRMSLDSCEGLLRYDIILTREERMGLEKRQKGAAKRDGLVQMEAQEGEGDLNGAGDETNIQHGIVDNSYLKRKGRETPDDDAPRYRKKYRSRDPDVVDDSGIEMMDVADNAEAEADMLDLDIEFDEGREMAGYPFDLEGEDTFRPDCPDIGGKDAFGGDDEKENRRPMGGGYIQDAAIGDQDYYDYEWKGEQQDAMGEDTWYNGYHHHRSPRRNLDDDYSRGFSLHQHYDVLLNPQAPSGSNQHPPIGENGPPYAGFDQRYYGGLNDGYDVDANNGYDYARPDDDQDYVGGSFEPLPLSFDSQIYQAASVRSSQVQAPPGHFSIQGQSHLQAQTSHANERSNELTTEDSQDTQASNEPAPDSHTETTDPLTHAITSAQANPSQAPRKTNLPSNGSLLDVNLATHSLGIATFARLRAKALKPTPSAPTSLTPSRELQVQAPPALEPQAPRDPPTGLYDRRTLRLPSEPRAPPTTTHKYLASLDLLQKQALVRGFRLPEHRVDLVERVTLDGVDLILDAHVALMFVPLLSLPAQTQAEALLARVGRTSWAFERLLIVFEAYPASRSVRSAHSSSSVPVPAPSAPSVPASSDIALPGHSNVPAPLEPGIYAYTPPVMKAIRKFRRDLDISEACGTKSAACVVEYAFADSVSEAAGFSRMFGDMVEVEGARERDEHRNYPGSVRWGDRAWLDLDPDEDEDGLAAVPGMNRFKAAAVLSQMTLGDFLDLDPEARVQMFGGIIGMHSVMAFNEEIERRLGALENYEEEQSASVQVPYLG